ncbi:hypothetical protein BN1708_011262 [Verticillium longisporum]|uniref:Uncharacterized protein n=1 Tax=Verticillium longisporum TaxID=100787 RepID=A0A0G4KYN6_VERLO|nr:hypothetical protein BN1708_011262 [Verticillium longisporum]
MIDPLRALATTHIKYRLGNMRVGVLLPEIAMHRYTQPVRPGTAKALLEQQRRTLIGVAREPDGVEQTSAPLDRACGPRARGFVGGQPLVNGPVSNEAVAVHDRLRGDAADGVALGVEEGLGVADVHGGAAAEVRHGQLVKVIFRHEDLAACGEGFEEGRDAGRAACELGAVGQGDGI